MLADENMFTAVNQNWRLNIIRLLPRKIWETPLLKIVNSELKNIPADILLGMINKKETKNES